MLVFTTYAMVLIPSLIIFGQLSDVVGRTRVIVGALAVSAIGLGLFAGAQNAAWLFAARAAQGLAVGSASATATASLVEFDPERDEGRAALGSVIGNAGGAATAPAVAALAAEWAPWPLVLCFLVGVGLTAVVAVAALKLPEPTRHRRRWRLQRPSVPAEHRPEFVRASLVGAGGWIVGALFLSIAPSYTGELLGGDNLMLRAAPTATMLATACAAHAVALKADLSPTRIQRAGLALIAIGLAALVVAWPLHSLPILLVAAVCAGAGLGLSFGGSQTTVNQLAPRQRRGEVTAAYITVVYIAITMASLTVGWLGDRLGVTAAVASVAIAVATATIALRVALYHR